MPKLRQALLPLLGGACLALSGCGAEHPTPNPDPTETPSSPVTIVDHGTLQAAAISPSGRILAAVDSGKIYKVAATPELLTQAPAVVYDLGFQGETPVALMGDQWYYPERVNLGLLEGGAWRVVQDALVHTAKDGYFSWLRLLPHSGSLAVLGLSNEDGACASYFSNVVVTALCSMDGCAPQVLANQPVYDSGQPVGPKISSTDLSATPEGSLSAFYSRYDLSQNELVEWSLATNSNKDIKTSFQSSSMTLRALLLKQSLYILGSAGRNSLALSRRGRDSTEWEYAERGFSSFDNYNSYGHFGSTFEACATADSIEVVWDHCSETEASGLRRASIRGKQWSGESTIPGTEYVCSHGPDPSEDLTGLTAVCGPSRLHVLWSTDKQGVRYVSLPTP